jgi:hypothetical protein
VRVNRWWRRRLFARCSRRPGVRSGSIWGRRQQARNHLLKLEHDGRPADAEIELVVQHAGQSRGRFLLTAALVGPASYLPIQARRPRP